MNRASRIARQVALAAGLLLAPAAIASSQITDVANALARIPGEAKPLVFERGQIDVPAGGHLQGIQMRLDAARNRHLAYLSHDSATAAYLLVVAFPADLGEAGRIVHVHTLPGDGTLPPLRHAGGIQLIDDVLVVGLEDNQQKTRSEIQFWNVSQAEKPIRLEHLTIRRSGEPKDKTAGAVGIVRRPKDHLLAVANWDSRAIDFYATNEKPLADAACRFEFLARAADNTFGAYQSVNLVTDAEGRLFLFGFHTLREHDVVDLFALDISNRNAPRVTKLSTKSLRLQPGNHFRNAAGFAIVEGGPAILSSSSQVGTTTTLSIAR